MSYNKFIVIILFIALANMNIAKEKPSDDIFSRKHTFYWSSTLPQMTSFIFFLKCEWDNFNLLRLLPFVGSNFDYKWKLTHRLKFLLRVNILPYYMVFCNIVHLVIGKNNEAKYEGEVYEEVPYGYRKLIMDLFSFDFGIEWKYKKNKNWSGSFTLGHSFCGMSSNQIYFWIETIYQKNLIFDITLAKYELENGTYIQFGRLRVNVLEGCSFFCSEDHILTFLISLFFNLISCHVGMNINTIHKNRIGKDLL